MKKLFVTDLDGTLVKNNYLPHDNQRYVKKLNNYGHCVTVATGRAYNGVKFLKSSYKLKVDYWVLLNGALIIDKEDNIVKHEAIAFNTVKQIVEQYTDNSWTVAFETGFKMYILKNGVKMFPYPVASAIKKIDKLENKKISLISLHCGHCEISKIDEICESINKRYGDQVVAYRNVRFIDVVTKGCSKGTGVEYVRQQEGISHKDSYAIGDSLNDIAMFEVVGNSFTMSNAEKLLHEKVTYVVDSVADCIKKYILKK
jgi:Cof subfamily protein (haloacid dehalogenase superfamily)